MLPSKKASKKFTSTTIKYNKIEGNHKIKQPMIRFKEKYIAWPQAQLEISASKKGLIDSLLNTI